MKLSRTITKDNYLPAMKSSVDLVKEGLKAGPVLVTIGRPKRSGDQNAKIHAMIIDIAKQVEFTGRKFTPEVWKALLVDEFEQEMKNMGEPLSTPSRVVISLDGQRAVTVRASTTDFRKKECANFIEYLYKFGAEAGVKWSETVEEYHGRYAV